MIAEPDVDVVCVGEAEDVFLELLDTMEADGDITTIRNIHVKRNGTIVRNPLRPLRQDLDSLPFPDRTLFNDYPPHPPPNPLSNPKASMKRARSAAFRPSPNI